MKRSVLVLVALAAVVSGCGGDASKDNDAAESVEDAIADTPQCSDIWEVGATLDLNTYEGCQDGDEFVAAVTRGCYDAESKYVGQVATFEDRLWVVQEGTDQSTGEGGTPGKVTDVDPKC